MIASDLPDDEGPTIDTCLPDSPTGAEPLPRGQVHEVFQPGLDSDFGVSQRPLWQCSSFLVSGVEWNGATDPADRRFVALGPPNAAFYESGSSIKWVDRVGMQCDPNHVSLFNAGQEVRIEHRGTQHARGADLWMNPAVLEDVFRHSGLVSDPARPFGAPVVWIAPGTCLRVWMVLGQLRVEPAPEALWVEEELLAIAGELVRTSHGLGSKAPRISDRTIAQVREVTRFLANDPLAKHRLGELAANVGCSKYHLSRMFVRVHGVTLSHYLRRLRLQLALPRILDRADDLTAVALASGFNSHSHFTYAFRREFGMPPSFVRDTDRRTLTQQLRAPRN